MAHPNNPFIRNLASSDRTVRTRALSSLRTYLSRANSQLFTSLDFLKLWKGLFYCLWMQDKPRNQQNLSRDLAELVDVFKADRKIGKENAVGWFEAFWQTMAREWGGIDGLRMDKYLFLVRCYVGKGFELCARNGWNANEEDEGNEGFMEQYLRVLEAIPLSARDPKVPNGLRYHVIDIYVDELEKADGDHKAPLDIVLRPLRKLQQETITKTVRERVKEALEDERLLDWAGDERDVEAAAGGAVKSQRARNDDETVMAADGDDDGEFGGFGD